jgi:hypothetical protein
MAVREDCRHYGTRTVASGDRVERCRIGMAELTPFACPPDCLFFEQRAGMSAGWTVEGGED